MAAKPGAFRVTRNNMPGLTKSLNALASTRVMVGIPAESTERKDGQAINNATIGYIQENGAPDANIPARPHMAVGVERSKPKWMPHLKRAGLDAMDGNVAGVEKELNSAGIIASQEVKRVITEVIPPPLADRTLAARRARGRTGTTPLLDTGQYRRAITWVLRNIGGK